MSHRTPLQIAFDKFPGRRYRTAKHIALWQIDGEDIYHASVEQHCAFAATPEDAIELAMRDYISKVDAGRRKTR